MAPPISMKKVISIAGGEKQDNVLAERGDFLLVFVMEFSIALIFKNGASFCLTLLCRSC